MRRLLLLAGLVLPMLLLPSPALAGTCPALAEGVVGKDAYGLGEVIEFFGTYNDFADPGTVTIRFERTIDGATREFTAFNQPDGAWMYQLAFESAGDVGRWNVTVVVDQTGDHDTCTDRVTIRTRSALPNTSTIGSLAQAVRPEGWPLALLALLFGLLAFRRRANQSPPPLPLP